MTEPGSSRPTALRDTRRTLHGRISLEPERIIDLGERIHVLSHFRAWGRDGIEVKRPFAHLWTVRFGLIVRMDAFSDQQKALDAAGLKE